MKNRKTPYDILPDIPYGKRPKVLLVGNGINISFCVDDTSAIIQSEWKKHYGSDLPACKDKENPDGIWKLPFPLQVVVATKDHVQGCMSNLADSFRDFDVSNDQTDFINAILNARFDAILSTNYSLEFEKSTIENYSDRKAQLMYKITRKQTRRQENFGIYQCTELPDDHKTLLWHIHGTALRKNSLVMGQLYYGKLLAEVIARANTVSRAYKNSITKRVKFQPASWIDYFLISDVHIMGFSLDYAETDIWWLLSYKKSVFPSAHTYFYAPHLNTEKKLMLECYNVETPSVTFNEDDDMKYIEYYKRICDNCS